VQARIRTDAELRDLWQDPAVRREATTPDAGMARLLELVRSLAADPAVQARIQADPVLRALWSDPAVRGRIQPTHDH
jgi:hypothetical protein